jgi:hypothetical protein
MVVREQIKTTKLGVLSGRQAKLNHIIFLVLYPKKLLTSYDIYLEIRGIKGYRHVKRQSVDRRIKALCLQGWLQKEGIRLAKAHFSSPLYKLSIRAQAALVLSKKNLNDFLQTAPETNLQMLIDALSICL